MIPPPLEGGGSEGVGKGMSIQCPPHSIGLNLKTDGANPLLIK